MKPPIAAVLICSFLAGCDGRGVLLYVKPPTASNPPWSVSSVVIPVEEPVDVIGIVSKVAADLGMKPASGPNHWSIATPPTGNFELLVQKDARGYWTVVLRDWPSIQRSEPSREAEAQIRAALKKKPNKAPEPTP